MPAIHHRGGATPGLLVDLYELTMAAAYLHEGLAEVPATFSAFVRTLPADYGFLVAAGLDDVLTHLEELRYTDADLDALGEVAGFDDVFLSYLGDLRFTGTVRAVPEGSPVFPDEPLLEVDAPLVQAQLLETAVLNHLTFATAITSTAARYLQAGRGRPVVDFALRRTQGIDAAMILARAVRTVGLAGTSNVAGARAYDVPVSGTMAHSFVQAHEDEMAAFRAFSAVMGDRTVLLVDTYDTLEGVRRAATVAREQAERGAPVRGIRLDSGDLVDLSRRARRILDEAGLDDLQIVVSGGLDEHHVDALVRSGAPIDAFGVGSALGVARGAPVLDTAYKLVRIGDRPVRKTSVGKTIWPDAKQVWRGADGSGDVLARIDEPPPRPGDRALLVEVMRDGIRTATGVDDLGAAHARFRHESALLPEQVRALRDPATYPVRPSEGLRRLVRRLEREGR